MTFLLSGRSRSRSRARPPARRPRALRVLLRAVSWHRRPLAALTAALAVLTALRAVAPAAPPEITVLVAAREVAGGTVLAGTDLEERGVRAADLPAGALSAPDQVIGRAVSAALAEGQVLTPLALVAPRAGPSAGRVVAPVRLADADLVTLLRPGDVVDLVGTDEQAGVASVVARGARVVTVPQVESDAAPGSTGGLVLVEVAPGTATELARAAAAGPLSPSWR